MTTIFDEIILNQCVESPSFNNMKQAYEDYLTTGKAPCKQKSIKNQCAVRMSIALVRCGFSLDAFPNQKRIHFGRSTCQLALPHIVGAHELARYLKTIWGVTNSYKDANCKNALTDLEGRKGIIYFNDVFIRANGSKGDHIDLWDGQYFYNYHLSITVGGNAGYNIKKMFRKANKIWFFELEEDFV